MTTLSSHHLFALSTLAMLTQACVIDTTSSQDLTCARDGDRQGERLCQNGVWVQSPEVVPSLDMTSDQAPDAFTPPDLDMPDPVDLPEGMDMPRDMRPADDMPQDMTCPAPNPITECAAQNACDTTLTLEPNACGDQILIDCPTTCAQGTCMNARCVMCPTTREDYCAAITAQNQNTRRVCGEWTEPALQGCPLPGEGPLMCACQDNDTCELSAGLNGTCNACEPLSMDTLSAGLPTQSCSALQLDDGCGNQVTLAPLDSCAAFESCVPSALMHRGQAVSTCQPNPAMAITLPNPAPSPGSGFGHSIAIEGDLMAIGAPYDTNGNPNNMSCGSVYVYERDPGNNTWSYQAQLVQGNSTLCNSGTEQFGWSVAIAERFIAVGAPQDGASGSVFIFTDEDNDRTWQRTPVVFDGRGIPVNSARYGHSVAMLYDSTPTAIANGTINLAVGVPDDRSMGGQNSEGLVYSYRYQINSGGGNDEIARSILDSPDDQSNTNYGERVLYRETRGTIPRLLISQPDWRVNNMEYGTIYESDALTPGTLKNLDNTPISGFGPDNDDEFGAALASDGPWIGVGAPQYQRATGNATGVAAIYHDTDSSLHAIVESWDPAGGDRFGEAIAIAYPWMLVGAPYEDGENNAHNDTGAVYLFEHDGSVWQARAFWRSPTPSSNTLTGTSVAITPEWAFFGVPQQGSGMVYMIPLAP